MNMKNPNFEKEWVVSPNHQRLWTITKQTKKDLFFSLFDILWDYDIDQWNFFLIKDILLKDKTPNKKKLWITIIRSKEKLIETIIIDVSPNEHKQFNKWKGNSLELSSTMLKKMPLLSKKEPKNKEKKENIEYKINPTNLEYLNLWNKAIVQGKVLDFSIVEYFTDNKWVKKPRIGILSLKTKEKRIISVHVEIISLWQQIIKELEKKDWQNIEIKTIVWKYRIQNIDLNSVNDNDILLPHLYDIQEREQKYQDKLLQLQIDIDHCNAAIDEGEWDIEELKEQLEELKRKDKKYTTIKVLYLTK